MLFYNMVLMSLVMIEVDVDLYTEVFGECVWEFFV